MKVIDKTTNKSYTKFDYGNVLKCWDKSPDTFDLLKIIKVSDIFDKPKEFYVIDALNNVGKNERFFLDGTYKSASDVAEVLTNLYDHVKKVNAVITISDLNDD